MASTKQTLFPKNQPSCIIEISICYFIDSIQRISDKPGEHISKLFHFGSKPVADFFICPIA